MKTSESIDQLATALSLVQAELRAAKAEAKGNYGKYADLEAVIDAIREPLTKNGFSFIQLPVTSTNGKPGLCTRLMHKSGQWIEEQCELLIEKATMQGMGSAITYMKRYSLAAMVGLAEEDDDGQAAEKFPQRPQNQGRPPALPPSGQAKPPQGAQSQPAPGMASDGQRKMIWARLKAELQLDDTQAKDFIGHHTGRGSSKELTRDDVQVLVRAIDLELKNREPGWNG